MAEICSDDDQETGFNVAWNATLRLEKDIGRILSDAEIAAMAEISLMNQHK